MMTCVNVFECADGTYAEHLIGERTQEVRTFTGIEFVLDGRVFRDYVVDEEGRALTMGDVTLFNSGLASPARVLLQQQPFHADPELKESGRTPILMCQCGDPYCGALMARVNITGQYVTWSDWVWDHFDEPSRPAFNIPDFKFDLEQYREELERAEERSVRERSVSVLEASWNYSFLDFLLPWREKSPRLNLRKRLLALDARPVVPSLDDARGDYAEFLAALEVCNAQVRSCYSRHAQRTDVQLEVVIEGLAGLLSSPFVERIPDITVDAMEWFLSDLRDYPRPV